MAKGPDRLNCTNSPSLWARRSATAHKAAGFTPSVQFANGGVTEQQNQISAMIEKGAKVLIVETICHGLER